MFDLLGPFRQKHKSRNLNLLEPFEKYFQDFDVLGPLQQISLQDFGPTGTLGTYFLDSWVIFWGWVVFLGFSFTLLKLID